MEYFLQTGVRKGDCGTPIAQETTLGWILSGNTRKPRNCSLVSLHCNATLLKTLSKFWEQEEILPEKFFTTEEQTCEELFDETHLRDEDGRFIVRLPFHPNITLGESRNIAVRSWLRMEKRLVANPTLYTQYNEFMLELIEMGHMEQVSETADVSFYMPHHPVVKDTSETTKVRVVFNASMKTSSGYSLNDALMIGPQLQRDLFSTLLRFRCHKYAMTADVQMYRQVRIADDHLDFQRIVWRRNPSEPLQDYRMLRVTYGVASASHLAVKSLQQTAKTEHDEGFNAAASTILNDFYMDDLMTGASTEEELSELQEKVSMLLSRGCFELRKWATNSKKLNKMLPYRSHNVEHFLASGDEVRTLGLLWNTDSDYLFFGVWLEDAPTKLTKRSFLSDASLFFDPLGIIAPCSIKAKIWFQSLWRADVDWDDLVPENIAKDWLEHREELKLFKSLKLERWLYTSHTLETTEFHVFADASERAFATVVYARSFDADGKAVVRLIGAKTKVAPLQTLTIPRLELSAAHLAAKFTKLITNAIGIPGKIYAWTDSTVTIAWLQGHPSRWSVFVANRVSKTQQVIPSDCWRHVRSEDNPADCASRGVTPSELLSSKLWWKGPSWLSNPSFTPNKEVQIHSTDVELRSCNHAAEIVRTEESWEILLKYSSYGKLKRVTAYAMRFISNIRASMNNSPKSVGPICLAECQRAEIALVKYCQNISFSNEISCCRTEKPIPLRSSLVRLQPFIDSQGLLRVGGRIKNAEVAADVKHPILLGKRSLLAKLIINDIHHMTLHAGPQIMQTILQRKFWVISSRELVRAAYRKCVKCTLLNRSPMTTVIS